MTLALLPSFPIVDSLFDYQLAFFTPGIRPLSARLRKQMRHVPNLRYTARGRPHSLQRDSRRDENFGVRFAFAILDLLATDYSLKKLEAS